MTRSACHLPFLLLPAVVLLASGCARLRPWEDSDEDGWVNKLDCAPTNAAVHPDAEETCRDGLDNNCNGLEDEYCEQMADVSFHELCAVNARGQVVCWHDTACGTNDTGEIVCWDPSRNLPLLDPQLTLAELETWARFPCGRSAFGDVTCVSPVRVASEDLPDGSTRVFSGWEISPAFRTLTPIVERNLDLEQTPSPELPP